MIFEPLLKMKISEFDYNFLLSLLSDYRHPRDKISELLKTKVIIRVKKGIYVLGPVYHKPYSLLVLANMIYGPSYISGDFALSHYGLIPEKVVTITSMTPKRKRTFATPVGFFSYEYLSMEKFSVGITWVSLDDDRSFLIASKEKALVDKIHKLEAFTSKMELKSYLVDGLRIDEEVLKFFALFRLKAIKDKFDDSNTEMLFSLIRDLK